MSQRGMSDETLLEALHLKDHEGLNRTQLANRFGVTRGSMIGALNRIENDTNATDPDGNQNGTMKPRWWKR
ncbi:hypothetical protein [Tritonibacter mobilis]|uniref:hypothetical protein n=2 Tax=Tritonibacter mobilis TaxID=379347 RepID=UPI000586E1F3|nr:hypothetical protein [Tritonibacter mobilis]